jgi:hypothetical protein
MAATLLPPVAPPPLGPFSAGVMLDGHVAKAAAYPQNLPSHFLIDHTEYTVLRHGKPVYTSRLRADALIKEQYTISDLMILGRKLQAPLPNGDTYDQFVWTLFNPDADSIRPISKDILETFADAARASGFVPPPDNRETITLKNGENVRIPVFPEDQNTYFQKKTKVKPRAKQMDAAAPGTAAGPSKPMGKKQQKIRNFAAVAKAADAFTKTSVFGAALMQTGIENCAETSQLFIHMGEEFADAGIAAAPKPPAVAAPAPPKEKAAPKPKPKKQKTAPAVETPVAPQPVQPPPPTTAAAPSHQIFLPTVTAAAVTREAVPTPNNSNLSVQLSRAAYQNIRKLVLRGLASGETSMQDAEQFMDAM